MVIEEKNSLKNFPYMFGNQVLIQSLSDGKTYYVMNYQNILNKFSPQFYVGDKIYGQVYNGKGTSYDIYEVDVFTGDRRKILEEANMNDYIVSNGTIVYDKTTLDETEILVARDIVTEDEIVITEKQSAADAYISLLGVYEENIFVCIEEKTQETIIRYNTANKEITEFPLRKDLYENDELYSEGLKDCMLPFGKTKLLIVFSQGGISEYDVETQEITEISSQKEAYNLLYGDSLNTAIGIKNEYLYYCIDGKGVYKKSMNVRRKEKAELIIPWADIVGEGEQYYDISMLFSKDYAVAVLQRESMEEEYKKYLLP